MVEKVIATPAALDLIEQLKAKHGPDLMFHQSGGCCDNSAANCYLPGEITIGQGDVYLGEAGCVPLRSRDLADLGTRKAPLHETLTTLFARRLRFELLRGVDRAYVNETDDLRLMRGKLVIGRHIARNTARRERFTCAFDEFTANTELSRVLKATCRTLLKRPRSAEAHEALSRCLPMLDDMADEIDARPLLDRIVGPERYQRQVVCKPTYAPHDLPHPQCSQGLSQT